MLAALAELALRRPWSLLAGSLAVLGAAVAIAIGAPDELGVGSMRLLDGPREPGPADAELVVVLSGDEPVDSRIFRVSRDVVVAQIAADPAVASVRELDGGETSVALVADLGGASDGERQEAAVRLAEEIDPGSLRARVGGEVQRLLRTRREAAGDLWRAELVVLPFVLLVAAAAAGLRRAAAPILCAAIAIVGSLAVLRLIGLAADVSLLGFAPAAAVGLVLGVELPLALLCRYRDQAAGAAPATALRATVTAGGRAALATAGVASVPAFAVLATPLEQAPSLALGCALAAVLAAASALVVTPAILCLSSVRRRADTRPGRVQLSATARRRSRARALATLGLGAAALCVLALPAFDARSAPLAVAAPAPGDSLFPELPIAAAIGAVAVALALAAVARTPRALALGPLSLLPAAAGVGACAFVFQQGQLAELLDSSAQPALDTGAVAAALCALGSIGAARSAATILAVRAPARPLLAPSIAATLIGALAAGAMVTAGPYPARELGLALAVGLAGDLLLLRAPLTPLTSRWIRSARV